jgi:hypothetical protein
MDGCSFNRTALVTCEFCGFTRLPPLRLGLSITAVADAVSILRYIMDKANQLFGSGMRFSRSDLFFPYKTAPSIMVVTLAASFYTALLST